jgi:hypothetical protein
MEETIQQVSSHPTHYTFLTGQYRDAALKTFPYRVIFILQETEVIVFAIFHTSRSEKAILKQLK